MQSNSSGVSVNVFIAQEINKVKSLRLDGFPWTAVLIVDHY